MRTDNPVREPTINTLFLLIKGKCVFHLIICKSATRYSGVHPLLTSLPASPTLSMIGVTDTQSRSMMSGRNRSNIIL